MNEIEYKIKQAIISELELNITPEDIKNDDFLMAGDYQMDSIQVIELIAEFEDLFDIYFEVDELDMTNFSCVNSIMEVVQKKIDERV